MRLLAISDLHITGPDDEHYPSLLALLHSLSAEDTLVIAGDLFDLFVGNKRVFKARYREFIRELANAAERGACIHYVEGNHDFLLRHAMPRVPRIRIHASFATVTIDGKRFYVAHGDLVNRQNYRYRLLRLFFRSPVFRLALLLLPGSLIDRLGHDGSKKSRKRTLALPAGALDRFYANQRRIFRNFAAARISEGFDFVILGHLHDADEMMFRLGTRTGQYVNVGDARVARSFLLWTSETGTIRRESLPS